MDTFSERTFLMAKGQNLDPKTGLPEGLDPSPERLTVKKEWRGLFPSTMVQKAGTRALQSSIQYFNTHGGIYIDTVCVADLAVRKDQGGLPLPRRYSYGYGRLTKGEKNGFTVTIKNAPADMDDEWKNASMTCNCPDGRLGKRCIHEAAVLLRWEKEMGGSFTVTESNMAYQKRQSMIILARGLKKRQEQMERFGSDPVSALGFFHFEEKPHSLVFFDLKKILAEYTTTPFYLERARTVRSTHVQPHYYGRKEIELHKEPDGTPYIDFIIRYQDSPFTCYVKGILRPTFIENFSEDLLTAGLPVQMSPDDQDENSEYDESDHVLNEYALDALLQVQEFIEKEESLGGSDPTAIQFFSKLEKTTEIRQETDQLPPQQPRSKCLTLEPRIIIEDGEARLGFKVARGGGRGFVLRNMSQFVPAYQMRTAYDLTKKESLDFSVQDFVDQDMDLLQFMARRVGETQDANAKLQEKAMGWRRPATLKEIASSMDLHGSLLDGFYDTALGRTCEYQDKTNGIKDAAIKIGHVKMHFPIRIERISDARGTFAGVSVSGMIPVMIKGTSHYYTLNKDALSRISDNERNLLAPFRSIADPSGTFRFHVGLDKLQEFYYRVLPNLLQNPCVDLDDRCSEEARQILPPEPEFSFWLDIQKNYLLCRCTVDYADSHFILFPGIDRQGNILKKSSPKLIGTKTQNAQPDSRSAGSKDFAESGRSAVPDKRSVSSDKIHRFVEQEKRIVSLLADHLGKADPQSHLFYAQMTDDELFSFLQNGIASLSRYGTVQGTEAFRLKTVRPVPQLTVGVSVSSNLMDLSVTSKDLDENELADLMESYRVRRRYHKLRSGDYIDLANTDQLREIEELLARFQLEPTEVIRKKAHLPLFRALYLDRLLEEHNDLASRRDRTFRAIAKNFRTINDSDFEPPASLADTLRPYQSYGYKWLKTLESAGFGGILADEMGLGKTLEMISLLLSDKMESGKTGSLIVCPASLVYNWQEEIRRFAPELTCCVLAGTKSTRKAAMSQEYDVFVTSYDLLRRDIALFEDYTYHICVLDEAQNIKNAKAAVTKAVKAIHSSFRFALTGTPIENRLSELWSIFDFLMPGFLYSHPEFLKRYEMPITKDKDEAVTQQLRRMTSPFILRRLKKDVLKDLPGKLEEVRYARVSGQQQKLYDAQVLRMKGILSSGYGTGEDKIRIFAELTRIRQICCDPSLLFDNYDEMSAKRELCMETIRSAIDGGHRILLFSQFTSMLDILKKDLAENEISFYEITGSTPKEKRIALVNAFNEGDTPVFLISLKAGGTGLNLTGADVVIHYDPWWNLAAQNQATDRAHRIGQTREVTVYKLILKDTIEEKILDLQDAKKDLAESILEGESASIMQMTGDELMELLN